MRLEVQHPAFKTQRLAVESAGWFTGPRLLVNGSVAKKQKGRYLVAADSGTETVIQVKYNFLDPIPTIKIGDESVVLAKPLRWYEYLWMGLPVVLIFSGGAIGGFVGAVAAGASGRIFRSDRGFVAKYGFSALITIGAVVAYAVLATIFQLLIGGSKR